MANKPKAIEIKSKIESESDDTSETDFDSDSDSKPNISEMVCVSSAPLIF